MALQDQKIMPPPWLAHREIERYSIGWRMGYGEDYIDRLGDWLDTQLWAVAGPTQVRPMSFFEAPNLREFLLEPESLRRIREAALIDDGSLIRK